MRLLLAFTFAVGLMAAAVAAIEIDTDARALVGDNGAIASALDTVEGRSMLLAIIDDDRESRSTVAREVVDALGGEPMVAHASTGIITPPSGLADWLWRERFTLSPPPSSAFTTDAMARELIAGKSELTSFGGAGLAHYYLLDPTGSFRRLIEALVFAASGGLPMIDGVLQSLDDTAALVTIQLSPMPFDVDAQLALDWSIVEQVEMAGAEAIIVGPRSIAAAISAGIEDSSKTVAVLGGALLLIWLVAVLRSATSILRVFLPLAIGFAAAAMTVQAAFGTVHVIALGFGGALMGLAIDYPLHLLSHARTSGGVEGARRLVLLGASTTAIAFLSLLGSGIPAIGQVGLFVSTGLGGAALAAVAIGIEGEQRHAWNRLAVPTFPPVRWKLALLAATGLVSGAVIAASPGPGARGLLELPTPVMASIYALDRMMDLPSGRYRIDVTAPTLDHLLAQQRRLTQRLGEARAEGALGRFAMLADKLPADAGTVFPNVEAFASRASEALRQAGLRESFQGDIVEAYRHALDRPALGPAEVAPLVEPLAPSGAIRIEGAALVGSVRLWEVENADRIEAAVQGLEGVSFIDERAALSARLEHLAGRITVCFLAGIAACAVVLVLALRRVRPVAEVMASCLAAAAVTAAFVTIIGGGLGVFTLVALALVVGIGIDYGIFLTLSEGPEASAAAMRSVGMCASTTLIAFLVMAFFGSDMLRDIGMTVSLGVAATALASFLRQEWGFARH
ncbi:MMPL family transporter [Limibaculum sp. M0105]|uniref:MMPL family transporter n=1 Tax=Thermohalobaculum xanthum TaxID=2753746 RepID=A0A8J7M9M0_9RHOB|nr:MMPL family transporter [Thermohalobaculum xanthum]MBK0400874.1 MMPL family transporter [Thermohalobaculum xanthum]